MAMKRALSLFITLILITACSNSNIVKKVEPEKVVKDIKKLDYVSGIDASKQIIEKSTARNYTSLGPNIYTVDNVLITATPLTIEVIQAKVKKRALERRWSHKKYMDVLDKELRTYTNFKYDKAKNLIVHNTEVDKNSAFTMSFNVSFENHTDPFRTIEVDGGFECFFLENGEGYFGRAESISDDYLFDYLLIDGFMSTIITFKTKNDFGQALFKQGLTPEKFSLVFNGMGAKSIKLNWQLSNSLAK